MGLNAGLALCVLPRAACEHCLDKLYTPIDVAYKVNGSKVKVRMQKGISVHNYFGPHG